MTPHEDFTCRLQETRSVGELRQILDLACADLAQILTVTVLCGRGPYSKRTCVIDFVSDDAKLEVVARRIGGTRFGYNSLIVSLPSHGDFTCARGTQPDLPSCSCTARS